MYKQVGNTITEWRDDTPLVFEMSEDFGPKDDRRTLTRKFDLSILAEGYEDDFLLRFKEFTIDRRNHVEIVTVKTEFDNLKTLFRRAIETKLFDRRISVIDESFLLALTTIEDRLSAPCKDALRRAFRFAAESGLFDSKLAIEDFPVATSHKGLHGKRIANILAKALKRAACVEILRRADEAYEDGQIDIGRYSFLHLSFAAYARPESYRQIKLEDLVFDENSNSFSIFIVPAKTGLEAPPKIPYKINKNVGLLLQSQRQAVIERFESVAQPSDLRRIPLFPVTSVHWKKNVASLIQELEFPTSGKLNETYLRPIQKIIGPALSKQLTHVNLRHTIGTNLAIAGCSATTIQSVLKHASNQTCRAYVDIAFQGLIDELSDALEPAFAIHLPAFNLFRSKSDPIPAEKAIHADDPESGRDELSGECGKAIRCEFAPLSCYDCNKFRPCFDADHSVNLDIARREITRYRHLGTPFQHLVQKYSTLTTRIELVMAACDRHAQNLSSQASSVNK